jgi:hypothetical protein
MFKSNVELFILCMLTFTTKIESTHLHSWSSNFSFAATYIYVIEFWNKKLFTAFYLQTNTTMYLMHITFAVYYRFCPRKTSGPFILKVPHIFMILFFFFITRLRLKGFSIDCQPFDSRWTWASTLRIGKMGLNFKLVRTNKGGYIVTHRMHIINFTKNAQIVPKCSSFTYCSFIDHLLFIDYFLFSNHSLLSLIDCSSLSLTYYSSFSFIDCSKIS